MTEQRDEQARIRELEGALHDARHFVYRCLMEEYAKGAGHNTLESLVTRMDSLLATSPPDSEPAEGAGHSSRDFEGTDPRGMGPLPGEPGNPNPSFEQMERQDAMLERRDCLESVADWLRHQHGLHIAGTDRTIDATEPMEALRQALSRTSDDECANELHRLAKVLGLPDDGPQENVDAAIRRTRSAEREIGFHWRPLLQWAVGTIDQINEGPLTWDEWSEDAGLHEQARQLAFAAPRTSDETMRHALFILRHGESPPEVTREDTIRRLERAIELDRAIAEQGEQRLPEDWKLVPVEPTDAMLATAEPAIDNYFEGTKDAPFEGSVRAVYQSMLAAAPQPKHGESNE